VAPRRYRGSKSVLSIMALLVSGLHNELPPPIFEGKPGVGKGSENLLPDEEAPAGRSLTCSEDKCSLIDDGDGPYCPICGASPEELDD
jgi:hypothetical protein